MKNKILKYSTNQIKSISKIEKSIVQNINLFKFSTNISKNNFFLNSAYNRNLNIYTKNIKNFFGKSKKEKESTSEQENIEKNTNTEQSNEKNMNNESENTEKKEENTEKTEESEKTNKSNEENTNKDTEKEPEKKAEKPKEDMVSLKKYNQLKQLNKDSEDKLTDVRSKFEELRKAYINLQDDMERFRKRQETEIANAKEFSISKFAKDILDVYDNFDRALDSLKIIDNITIEKIKEEIEDENSENTDVEKTELSQEQLELKLLENKLKSYGDFSEGVEMTKSSLNRILNFHGVKEFNPINEKFDTNKHEAVCVIPSDDLPNGTVAAVVQSGFSIGKRVLRPAKVGVVKK